MHAHSHTHSHFRKLCVLSLRLFLDGFVVFLSLSKQQQRQQQQYVCMCVYYCYLWYDTLKPQKQSVVKHLMLLNGRLTLKPLKLIRCAVCCSSAFVKHVQN